jgi:hypothetical protein
MNDQILSIQVLNARLGKLPSKVQNSRGSNPILYDGVVLLAQSKVHDSPVNSR